MLDRVLGREREAAAVCVELTEDDVAGSVIVEETVRAVLRHPAYVDILTVANICTYTFT